MRPVILLLLLGCAKHFEAKVDASHDTSATTDVTTHETEIRQEEPIKIVTVTTRPDGTRRERTVYKGAVAVRRELEADAKSLLDSDTNIASQSEGDSKPSFSLLGFLGLNWLWLVPVLAVVLAVAALIGFRKSSLVQRLAKFLPFPFSLLAVVAAPAEQPKE